MCNSRRVLTTLIALMAISSRLSAQTAADESARAQAELQARLMQLAPQLKIADARAKAAETLHREQQEASNQPLDTIQVGPITIITVPGQTDAARELFEREWRAFEPIFGDHIEGFGTSVFTFRQGLSNSRVTTRSRARQIDFGPMASRAQVHRAIQDNLGAMLVEVLPDEIAAWEGEAPLKPSSAEDVGWIYRELVLAPSAVAKGCVMSAASNCWAAIGLVPAGANPIDAWYSAADQKILVEGQRGSGSAESQSLRGLCLNGTQSACREWLLEFRTLALLTPASMGARANLLWFALKRGGSGAIDRLRESLRGSADGADVGHWQVAPGVAQAEIAAGNAGLRLRRGLEAASGMDRDALIAAWQASLTENGPTADPIEPSGPSRNATMLWMLFFAGLATRSTRWRLG